MHSMRNTHPMHGMHDTYARHELGQNLLADPHLIAVVQRLVRNETSGPILELGAGDGALTKP
jgi:23S rRNA (adenine-N6)-dimethyltransferase